MQVIKSIIFIALIGLVYQSKAQQQKEVTHLFFSDSAFNSTKAIGIDAFLTYQSDYLNNNFVFKLYQGGFLNESTKNKTKAQLELFNNAKLETEVGASFFIPLKDSINQNKQGFLFSVKNRVLSRITFTNQLFELLFYGNASFVDKQIDLSGVEMQYINFYEARAVWIKNINQNNPNAFFGGGLSIYLGKQFLNADLNQATFYTHPYGEQIDFSANYQWQQSGLENNDTHINGEGVGCSFFYAKRWPNGDKLLLLSEDLGVIRWNKLYTKNQAISLSYQGIESTELFSYSPDQFIETKDSLLTLFRGEKNEGYTLWLSPLFQFNYHLQMPFYSFDFSTDYRIKYSAHPSFYTRMNIPLKKQFILSPLMGYNGYYSIVCGLQSTFIIKKKIDLTIGTSSLGGLLRPAKSSAFQVYGKVYCFF